MTITDSTTTLDTAWTEQSIVPFTAGVLSTLANCVSEVEAKLKRGTLTTATAPTLAQVENWLRRAKLELVEIFDFSYARKYAVATSVAGTYRYALPPDYNGGELSLRDVTNNSPITIWPKHQFDMKFPDPSEESAGPAGLATIKNMELWVVPPSEGGAQLELEYSRSGAETTADDFSWLPEIDRFRCCDFAVSHAFYSLHMWNEGRMYKDEWYGSVQKAKVADGRKKWKGRSFQAISVFQEYAMKNNQPKRNQ